MHQKANLFSPYFVCPFLFSPFLSSRSATFIRLARPFTRSDHRASTHSSTDQHSNSSPIHQPFVICIIVQRKKCKTKKLVNDSFDSLLNYAHSNLGHRLNGLQFVGSHNIELMNSSCQQLIFLYTFTCDLSNIHTHW